MKKFVPVLKRTKLFRGISDTEIVDVLSCLGANAKEYKKGAYVIRQGDTVEYIAVLIEGELHVRKEDYWGNLSIVSRIAPGEMFGEAYAAPDSGAVQSDVVATEKSTVLFLHAKRMLTTCSSACRFHTAVVENLVFSLAEKNRCLIEKLEHMAKRSTREKLVSYLSEEAEKQKKNPFTVPFNRQEMADFLSVDRSAMSKELCKMRDERLLRFHKNEFELL